MSKPELTTDDVKRALEVLVGQPCEKCPEIPSAALTALGPDGRGLGYSQLNEILLLLGFDRIRRAFFQFLATGEIEYKSETAIRTYEDLQTGIDRFRKLGLLLYGNVKFAFKALSDNEIALRNAIEQTKPIAASQFYTRHDRILPIDPIPPEDTYYLGYVIERELNNILDADPDNSEALEQEARRKTIIEKGKRNQVAYLVSDHMDVYVATSMRKSHEYVAVNRLTKEIFQHKELSPLKLRWFDPTQAYCMKRIDKGLSEALMLRRAACTIYLAQEIDTLGKDSELASTLAQGKTVIAFVPDATNEYTNKLLDDLRVANEKATIQDLVLEQLQLFKPNAAWDDKRIREWAATPQSMAEHEGLEELSKAMTEHYNKRADLLKGTHPLGIQVNLGTGVANGVLVVRDIESCAKLVKRIVTRTLEFWIDEQPEAIYLRESISGCIYRVSTSDSMLTNTFWNFYLEPSE